MKENLVKSILTRGTEYIKETQENDDNFTHLLSDLEDVLNESARETWSQLELKDDGDGQYHLAKLILIIMTLKTHCNESGSMEVDCDAVDSAMNLIHAMPGSLFMTLKHAIFGAFSLGRADGLAAARLEGIKKWQIAPEENPTIELTPA